MPVPVHGLSSVRTLTAIKRSSAQGNGRHVCQFRLAALELECSRLHHEKQAAERRVAGIMARLAEIRKNMQEYREQLYRGDTGPEPTSPRRVSRILRY